MVTVPVAAPLLTPVPVVVRVCAGEASCVTLILPLVLLLACREAVRVLTVMPVAAVKVSWPLVWMAPAPPELAGADGFQCADRQRGIGVARVIGGRDRSVAGREETVQVAGARRASDDGDVGGKEPAAFQAFDYPSGGMAKDARPGGLGFAKGAGLTL